MLLYLTERQSATDREIFQLLMQHLHLDQAEAKSGNPLQFSHVGVRKWPSLPLTLHLIMKLDQSTAKTERENVGFPSCGVC